MPQVMPLSAALKLAEKGAHGPDASAAKGKAVSSMTGEVPRRLLMGPW